MKIASVGLMGGLILAAAQNAGATISLYNGAQAGLPESQGWLAYQSALSTATETLASGGVGPTTLNTGVTSGNSEAAGWSNFKPTGTLVNSAFPTLNPATGFDLTFNMQLNSESHSGSTDRAGFSVLLLGSDLNGVELGFWPGQVWAQNNSPIFTHTAEQDASFNPSDAFYNYDLHIQGSTYTLFANGSQILTGPTRNYTANTLPYPLDLPYETPDFVFLGDDTNDAQSVAQIQSIGIAVPEPAGGAIVLGAMALLGRKRRRFGLKMVHPAGSDRL